jgi:hypothetical protein
MNHSLFYIPNKDTYPPFKNGLYLEEYFHQEFHTHKPDLKRTYIPLLWTNFQIDNRFGSVKHELQKQLDDFILSNPNPNGYFTIVQHDDGALLTLPDNTIVFNAGNKGNVPLPLIYEDKDETLVKAKQASTQIRDVFCSFVGRLRTHPIRDKLFQEYQQNPRFKFISSFHIPCQQKNEFIDITLRSRFALAPRGYGRTSFRFFELLTLGAIPIYVWDDVDWLPYKDIIDYSKFSIVIHEANIPDLETILLEITEERYQQMIQSMEEHLHYFTMQFLYKYITTYDM